MAKHVMRKLDRQLIVDGMVESGLDIGQVVKLCVATWGSEVGIGIGRAVTAHREEIALSRLLQPHDLELTAKALRKELRNSDNGKN